MGSEGYRTGRRGRILSKLALAQDIGIDGDDAVEFFEEFGERFHPELSQLGDHWDQHFMPEGGRPSFGCMVVIFVGVMAGGLLHDTFRWIPEWVTIPVLVALLAWFYGKVLGEPPDEKIPITIQDLVDAANSGRWVKLYTDPTAPSFRTFA